MEILAAAAKIKNLNPTPEQLEISSRGKSMLLAIPGHARFFRDRLEQKKQDMLAGRDNYFEYTKAQEALSILAYLPSPETVAVLGELIGDPVGRDGKALGGGKIWEGDGWLPVNSQIALACFEALPIENGPKLQQSDFGEENFEGVDKWKDWWNEVKAGKRTYRFVGSPIEYGPDGPVAAKELQRREHDRQRDGAPAGAAGSNGSVESPALKAQGGMNWMAALGAALAGVLLLIAGWKAFGKRGPRAD